MVTFFVEGVIFGNTFAEHLTLLYRHFRRVSWQHQHTTADERLNRFAPHTAVGGGKGYMAVIEGLAHGHVETYAERTDIVGILVAVVEHRIYHLDLGSRAIEIEADEEWQPFAPIAGAQLAIDFNDSMFVALTFDYGRVDLADIVDK